MSSFQNISRLKKIDQFIQQKDTGRPRDLAHKIGISERLLFIYIRHMRNLGAPIAYDKASRNYYYRGGGKFQIGYVNPS